MNMHDFRNSPKVSISEVRAGQEMFEETGRGIKSAKVFEVIYNPTCSRTQIHIKTGDRNGPVGCYYRDAPVVVR